MAGPNIPVYWDENQFKKVVDETKLPLTGGNITGSLTVATKNVVTEGYACYPVIKELTDVGGALLYKGGQVGVGDMTKSEFSAATGVVKDSQRLGTYLPNMANSTSTVAVRNASGYLYAARVYGAVYNDYAEYRSSSSKFRPGTVVTESESGLLNQSNNRLNKIPMVVSDTFGFCIGETNPNEGYSIPIAVSGRVLVYTDKERSSFKIGDAVCAGINGTASKMKWWEKILFPDRILGLVSEIPKYDTWGTDGVVVNKRVWIKI